MHLLCFYCTEKCFIISELETREWKDFVLCKWNRWWDLIWLFTVTRIKRYAIRNLEEAFYIHIFKARVFKHLLEFIRISIDYNFSYCNHFVNFVYRLELVNILNVTLGTKFSSGLLLSPVTLRYYLKAFHSIIFISILRCC